MEKLLIVIKVISYALAGVNLLLLVYYAYQCVIYTLTRLKS